MSRRESVSASPDSRKSENKPFGAHDRDGSFGHFDCVIENEENKAASLCTCPPCESAAKHSRPTQTYLTLGYPGGRGSSCSTDCMLAIRFAGTAAGTIAADVIRYLVRTVVYQVWNLCGVPSALLH